MEGDEQLFEHVFLTHFESCYVYLVREDRAIEHLAYDAVMDALVKFRSLLLTNRIGYGNLRFLLTRMARQHYQKMVTRERVIEHAAPHLLSEVSEPAELVLEPAGVEHLRRAWHALSDDCRELLHAYYYRKLTLKLIAEQMHTHHATLRKRKQRCLDGLRSNMKRGQELG